MTEKELLYVEDALAHEKYFKEKCSETIENLQDPELKSLVSTMMEKHNKIYQSFYNLL